MPFEKPKTRLAAILMADVQGFSRLVGEDEAWADQTLRAYREVLTTYISRYNGRTAEAVGDKLLAEFPNAVEAVQAAEAIQIELKTRNAPLPENRRMAFRIGVNLGDVTDEGGKLSGSGIRAAEKVESTAAAGGICISGTVYDYIKNKLPLGCQYLGTQNVKDMAKPVRVYRVLMAPKGFLPKLNIWKGAAVRQWERLNPAVKVLIALAAIANGVWHIYPWFSSSPHPASKGAASGLKTVASKDRMAYPLPDKPSIAVLPFANLNNDPKEDYICDGLTEQIITSLSTFQKLFVIARNSSFAYKGKAVKVQQVAEDLGVQYVLEGSVLKSGEKLRITAQLIDALAGHHVWSERYDRELKDFFALQDEITIHILNAMKAELTIGPLERQYAKVRTKNLKAYEKNYQGVVFYYKLNKQDNETARRLFQEALALDPKYYWPQVMLGFTYLVDARYGWSDNPPKSIQQARECAKKALAMDESLDTAHSLVAFIYVVMRQYDQAIAEVRRAVDINPNGALPIGNLALILGAAGQWEQSILQRKQAMRLNPIHDPGDYVSLGKAYFMTGKLDESIATLKKAVKINPDYLFAHILLAANFGSLNRSAEAAAAAKEILRLNPHFTLEAHAKTLPYKNKEDIGREIAALRQAGLK